MIARFTKPAATSLAICAFVYLYGCRSRAYDAANPVQPAAQDASALATELDDLTAGKAIGPLPVAGSDDGSGFDPYLRGRIETAARLDQEKAAAAMDAGAPLAPNAETADAGPKVDCDPPYRTDAKGHKVYKTECLPK